MCNKFKLTSLFTYNSRELSISRDGGRGWWCLFVRLLLFVSLFLCHAMPRLLPLLLRAGFPIEFLWQQKKRIHFAYWLKTRLIQSKYILSVFHHIAVCDAFFPRLQSLCCFRATKKKTTEKLCVDKQSRASKCILFYIHDMMRTRIVYAVRQETNIYFHTIYCYYCYSLYFFFVPLHKYDQNEAGNPIIQYSSIGKSFVESLNIKLGK